MLLFRQIPSFKVFPCQSQVSKAVFDYVFRHGIYMRLECNWPLHSLFFPLLMATSTLSASLF